jgi:hypothetical protein
LFVIVVVESLRNVSAQPSIVKIQSPAARG